MDKIQLLDKTALATALKMAIGGLLAFAIYNAFDRGYGYWSVITVATITQFGLTDTLLKGFMRIIGTILGASIGYTVAIMAQGNLLVILSTFFGFITLSSFFAVQPTRFSYGGIVFGITLAIVLASGFISDNLTGIAITRSIEVLTGIGIVFFIDFILSVFIFKLNNHQNTLDKFKDLPFELKKFRFKKKYLWAAIKIALACLITSLTWTYFKIPEGFWATITCLTIVEESTQRTQEKSLLRFFAHVIAALFGAFCALIIGEHYWWRLLPLVGSFFFCGYLIGLNKSYTYFGNTMAVAIAIMLLVDPGPTSSFETISFRLLNVVFGILVATIVLKFCMPSGTTHQS